MGAVRVYAARAAVLFPGNGVASAGLAVGYASLPSALFHCEHEPEVGSRINPSSQDLQYIINIRKESIEVIEL